MSVDGKLLDILCCPVSKTPLTRLSASRLKKLNKAISDGGVQTVRGETVDQPLREALVTEDSKVIYPVIDDIPMMLEERGSGITQVAGF